ncbi:MAG: thioredoxin family protein [Rhodospirillales bacterium]
MRAWATVLAAAVVAVACAGAAAAAELVVFSQKGCVYCAAWERDVGRIFDRTDEARLVGLRRVDMDAPRPADLAAVAPVRVSPTFVVVEDGREIGRILGYRDQDQFWGLLHPILDRLAKRPAG